MKETQATKIDPLKPYFAVNPPLKRGRYGLVLHVPGQPYIPVVYHTNSIFIYEAQEVFKATLEYGTRSQLENLLIAYQVKWEYQAQILQHCYNMVPESVRVAAESSIEYGTYARPTLEESEAAYRNIGADLEDLADEPEALERDSRARTAVRGFTGLY